MGREQRQRRTAWELRFNSLVPVARGLMQEARNAWELMDTLIEFAPPEQAEAVRALMVTARASLDEQERIIDSTIGKV